MTGEESAGPAQGVIRVGSLFTGAGMLDAAVCDVFPARVAWHCEYEPPTRKNPRPSQAAAKLLEHRFPDTPNHGDVATVDWSSVGPVDVLTGGFPCQDISSAGLRTGLRPGTRSGSWSHMSYAISQLRPGLVVIENVRGLLSANAHCELESCSWCVGNGNGRSLRALGAVLGDLADLGYDARWCGIRASDVGAPHGRFRVFIVARPVADTDGVGPIRGGEARGRRTRLENDGGVVVADPAGTGRRSSNDVADNGEAAVRSGETEFGRCGGAAAADTAGNGWREGRAEPARKFGGPDVAQRREGTDRGQNWGVYESAIRRWELILGRAAPDPTLRGKRGGQQLNPAFVEFMMGWPRGWVTDVPGLTRNDQLRILGNGVVPQQASAALCRLLWVVASRFAA